MYFRFLLSKDYRNQCSKRVSLHPGVAMITGLSNANGRAVDMTVFSRTRECSCDTSRLCMSLRALSSVRGVPMLRVDGRI